MASAQAGLLRACLSMCPTLAVQDRSCLKRLQLSPQLVRNPGSFCSLLVLRCSAAHGLAKGRGAEPAVMALQPSVPHTKCEAADPVAVESKRALRDETALAAICFRPKVSSVHSGLKVGLQEERTVVLTRVTGSPSLAAVVASHKGPENV